MARFSFRLPDISEGIAEAEIVVWHVKIGDRIEEDAQLADMMTDKATVEMESPVSGIVVELAGEVGDLIPIGSTLAVIETDSEGTEAPVEEEVVAETPGAGEVSDVDAVKPTPEPVRAEPVEAPTLPSEEKNGPSTRSGQMEHGKSGLASPAVRARARDQIGRASCRERVCQYV